jgi:hypothetical protein
MRITFTLILYISLQLLSAQKLKPYVIGAEASGSVSEVKTALIESLENNNLEVVGSYMPASDKNRYIVAFTCEELISAIQSVGGATGFAAVLRCGITMEGGKTLISYNNPEYWGNAYFRENYSEVASKYVKVKEKLVATMMELGNAKNTPFGSEKGIEEEELREYHYMFGMPYFDDFEELREFDSYENAVAKIESNLKSGVADVEKVYAVEIPGKKLKLYGLALSGENGEGNFMPIIDIGDPKHTAFLPYEILVMGDEVLMLHGRYRIAISFPDLTMGTFSKIMSTPGDIEELMEKVVD